MRAVRFRLKLFCHKRKHAFEYLAFIVTDSFLYKNGYTKQELNDFQCNKLYMMNDLIDFQKMYSHLAYVPEIKSINQNTIELREEILKNVRKYNFKCTNELINIPLDTSKL